MAERLSRKRASKLPKTFKDYVSADENSRLLVKDEVWFLVRFEDEGQVYCALPKQDVYPIFPNGFEDNQDNSDDELPEEGDYVDAKWPGDGKLYDAKVIQMGTKTDMRVLRVQLERQRKHLESLEVKEKEKQGKKKTTTVKQTKSMKTEQKNEKKQQDKSEKSKKNEDQKVQDQEKREKLKKKEEATAKRLEIQQKREAELKQARENVKEFNLSRCDDVDVIFSEPPAKKIASQHLTPFQYSSDNEIMERLKLLEEENKQLKDMVNSRTEEKQPERDQQEYEQDIAPGVLTPEKARISKMVPLLPGSFVYLSQGQKNAAYHSKPTILVRNLMRVFFTDQILKRSNYGGGGPRGYDQLNPRITKAILGSKIVILKSIDRQYLFASVEKLRAHAKFNPKYFQKHDGVDVNQQNLNNGFIPALISQIP